MRKSVTYHHSAGSHRSSYERYVAAVHPSVDAEEPQASSTQLHAPDGSYSESTNYHACKIFHSTRINKQKQIITERFTDNQGTKCNTRRCMTCPSFTVCNKVTSSHTSYEVKTMKSLNASCTSANVIYLISCNTCKLQYVGETATVLRNRINHHRSSINNPDCETYIAKHFRESGHVANGFSVTILDDIDVGNKQDRLAKELYWINLLQTAFPFGLNDQIKEYGNISNIDNPLRFRNNPYNGFQIKRYNKHHGQRTKTNPNTLSNEDLIALLVEQEANTGCKLLNSIHKKQIKDISNMILHDPKFTELEQYTRLKLYACLSKFYFKYHKLERKPKELAPNKIKLIFYNPYISRLKIPKLFNGTLNNFLKESSNTDYKIERTMLIYKYEQPISSLIFNYNYFLKQLTLEKIKQIMENRCICQEMTYNRYFIQARI